VYIYEFFSTSPNSGATFYYMCAGVRMSKERKKALKKIALLREEFLAVSVVSDMHADFWRLLPVDRRRTLAALAGVEDTQDFCSRKWELISQQNKTLLAETARDWARMLAPMRWA
jgi:hypothetical protein